MSSHRKLDIKQVRKSNFKNTILSRVSTSKSLNNRKKSINMFDKNKNSQNLLLNKKFISLKLNQKPLNSTLFNNPNKILIYNLETFYIFIKYIQKYVKLLKKFINKLGIC